MDKNKVKIELYKSKAMANFSHYKRGELFYTVELEDGKYMFPIETTEYYEVEDGDSEMELSSDLGDTSFGIEIKASELNRWIGKAIDNKEFIKISK